MSCVCIKFLFLLNYVINNLTVFADNPMLLVMEFVKKGCLLAFLRHNAKQLRDMKQKLLRFAIEICDVSETVN